MAYWQTEAPSSAWPLKAQVSVGDVFQFGEVHAQAAYPRIPCAKVNLRMRHPGGQKALQDCGRSGIYFRILKAGKIFATDQVKRIEVASHRFLISDLYRKIVAALPPDRAEVETAVANGAFPRKLIEKWTARLKG